MPQQNIVTKENLKTALGDVGVKKGMTILVHSSLSSMGRVEGGAHTVIDSILEAIGDTGTVIMPTYSLNRRQIDECFEEILPFDPATSPAWTGIIAETFRTMPGVVRSNHPTHSLAAKGPKAEKMIKSINRIYIEHGYVLLMGVNLDVISAIHLSELIARPSQLMKRIYGDQSPTIRHRIVTEITLSLSCLGLRLSFIQSILEMLNKNSNKKAMRQVQIKKFASHGPWIKSEALMKTADMCREAGIIHEAPLGIIGFKLLQAKSMIDLLASDLKAYPDHYYCYRPSTYNSYLRKKAQKENA